MKGNKNSLILLGALLLGLVLVAYYMLYYQPTQDAITQAQLSIEEKRFALDAMNAKILSEKLLDQRIEETTKRVRELSERFFVDLEQEEALEISSGKLNESQQIVFDQIGHRESEPEDTATRVISQSLEFDTDYHSLMEYLRKLRRNDKNIAVRSMDLVLDRDIVDGAITESLETELALDFIVIPSLESLGVKDEVLLRDVMSTRDLSRGPFVIYDGYVDPLERQLANSAGDPDSTTTDNSGSWELPTEPVVPEIPKYMIYDFEDNDAFFVGSDDKMGGSLIRSKSRKSGEFALDLTFDFFEARAYNVANLVFAQGAVVLPKQPALLTIQIYSYEHTTHNIGLQIVDAVGRDFYVSIANGVNWLEWSDVTIDLPEDITYPAVIQRIYIEGVGYGQKLRGRYLFDQMQVQYVE